MQGISQSTGFSNEEVLLELENVLASKQFAASERFRRFLTHVVQSKLRGDVDGLKESVLGAEVFDRTSEYDPKIDSIVRVYAGRLRTRLDDYYRDQGVNSPLRISLPTGGYVPVFEPLKLPPKEPGIVSPSPVQPNAGVRRQSGRRFWILLVPLVALGIAVAGFFWSGKGGRVATTRVSYDSIAVLPFIDLTGDAEFRYFGDGLTEELISTLAHLRGLRVISRTSSFMFRGHETDIPTIAKSLNVSTILEGSVRRRGSGVRVSARLIDARSGSELWSEMFDRELKDTVLLEEDISRAIIGNLKVGPLLPAAAESTNHHVPPADAYHAYLKGRYMWSRVTPADFQKAVSQFEEAIALDPGYAPSYLALAQAYSGVATFAGVVKPRDAWPQCKAMAEKALELDPTLGEAHTTLAGAKANYDWDQVGAEAEYKRGVELAPGSSIAHQFYATFLGSLKRWPEADAQMAEARRLDPLWNLGIWGDAQLSYWEGHLSEADQRVQALIAREPDFVTSYALVAQIYFQQGRSHDAIRLLMKAPDAVRQTARWIGSVGYLYAVTGNTNEAQNCLISLQALAVHEVVSPFLAGMIYQGLGDKDRAIQLIGEALDERLLRPGWIAVDPMFDPIRSDPRFQSLIRKVGDACRVSAKLTWTTQDKASASHLESREDRKC